MSRRWVVLALAVVAGAGASAMQPPGPATDPPALLVSRQLRESQGLAVGEIVYLSADASGADAKPFRVAASYEPVPDPMRLGAVRHEVRLHLPDLLTLIGARASPDPAAAETVDAINVALARPADAQDVGADLSQRLPGISAHATAGDESRSAPFIVLERFHLAIAIVTVIASSIFLLAMMLMMVDERRETVGVLRLIGFRRARILLYVCAEGLVLTAAGAAFGILLAAAFQGGINRFFQWRYDTALVFVRITPAIAARSIAMAVPLGVLAALASSWSLLRREVFSLTRR